jgi:hypothetical protein
MNEATLNYVRQHADDDVRQLALRGCKDVEVDLPMALQQIMGRQTACHKLPSWAAIEGVVYPPRISMEQCSSEATARYKAKVIDDLRLNGSEAASRNQIVNRKLIDLTAGFGVDLAFMSQAFDQAVYVERDPDLFAIAETNMPLVAATPVQCVCADGTDFFRTIDHCTMFFLDPARRDEHGGRTYALADCTPNVIPIIDDLLARADTVMLKLSPMLDWRKAVNDLGPSHVAEVHIVAVDNECKELLIVLQREARPLRLVCVDIDSALHCPSLPFTSTSLPFTPSSLPFTPPHSPSLPFHSPSLPPDIFLYEPNAAIMKSGCFDALARAFSVSPISHDSHLFTADRLIADFPGRRFRITATTTMNKRDLRHTLGGIDRANITVRHFPLSADQLRRRLKLADGGNLYLFATTLAGGQHLLLLCTKA